MHLFRLAVAAIFNPCVWGALTFLIIHPASGAPPLRIIDVHVHTAPTYFKAVDNALTAMGVTRFVNLSGGTIENGLPNNLEAAKDFDGRLRICMNLNWRTIDRPNFITKAVGAMIKAHRLGAACLKISKALGLYITDPKSPDKLLPIDAPLLDPIWRTAGTLGMPIFIHSGDPKAFFEPFTPANERYAELALHPNWSFHDPRFPRREEILAARDRVIARHPNTIFVGVHFANNPESLGYVDALLAKHPNLYVDIAARLPEIGRHPAEKVRALFIRHQDRIMFGSDLGLNRAGIMLGSVGRERPTIQDIFAFYARHFQWFESSDIAMAHPTPIQGNWTINGIGLPEGVLRKIYALNALKLLWPADQSRRVDEDAVREGATLADFLD